MGMTVNQRIEDTVAALVADRRRCELAIDDAKAISATTYKYEDIREWIADNITPEFYGDDYEEVYGRFWDSYSA